MLLILIRWKGLSEMETTALCIGVPRWAAGTPLWYGLRDIPGVRLVVGDLQTIRDAFEATHLHAALLPVWDCINQPQTRVIPGLGVVSEGSTRCEWLLPQTDLQGVTVAGFMPGHESRTLLARVVLMSRYRVAPEWVEIEENQDAQKLGVVHVGADAGLYRGSGADDETALDLGEAWAALTNLPAVHSLWQVHLRAPVPRLRAVLSRAQQGYEESLDAVVAEEAARLELPEAMIREHLSHFRYKVATWELEGLNHLLDRAGDYGFIAPGQRVALA